MVKPQAKPIQEPDLVDAILDWIVSRHPDMKEKAPSLMADIRADWGASRHYVRAGSQTERQRRISQALSLFNGRNATEVARPVGVSRGTVYRIVKQPR
jgi:Mor family transcriptional regulator